MPVHPLVKPIRALVTPFRGFGGFVALSLDVLVVLFRSRFAWREFIEQLWFIARVSTGPGAMVAFGFNVLAAFMFNVLLLEIGAADLSGAGVALAVVSQTAPITTTLALGGAAATAMCADLGSRTIREEIDAMKVMGVDPVQRLVVPRVVALAVSGVLLFAVVCTVCLVTGFSFSVYFQDVNPGSFMASLTLLTGLPDLIVAIVKALVFGATAGLIACYKGLHVAGGSQGVGTAVNETVVLTYMALFVLSTVLTTVGDALIRVMR
ncbi:MlaE family ABC transporter permease [Mycobacterium heckeshornense]|nr:ABC transporter permease [Mycobacterium heckeshornense]KMV17507.1 ABC transporter permease [Mycobacterium heckeshornense]MCV7035927.1 ABC transporter permease [Mycobacterium heckeshornense]